MSVPAYHVTDDADLKSAVRGETGYRDTADELPQSDLDQLVSNAKLTLATRVDLDSSGDNWYDDRGLGLALLGVTSMKAKARVENFSVTSWSLGGGDVSIETDATTDEEIQVQHYESMIRDGLADSDVVTGPNTQPTNISSTPYMG